MKKFYLFLILLEFCFAGYSQDYSFPKNSNGKYEFSEIVNANLSKSTLFANATSWAIDFYKEEGYKNVVQIESEIDGRLVIKNYNEVVDFYTAKKNLPLKTIKIYYTLTIDCKDNKYRYIINDIELKSPSTSSTFGGILGSDLEWDQTHESHLDKIKEYQNQINVLNAQMQNTKGKKLSKLQKQVDDYNEKIKSEHDMYIEEYSNFERLIRTLKEKMANNSDF